MMGDDLSCDADDIIIISNDHIISISNDDMISISKMRTYEWHQK